MSIFNFLYLPLKPTTNNAQPTTQNMSRDQQLKERWEQLVNILSNQFSQGEDLDLDAIIYLIGVQELGKVHNKFKKDEKLNQMHIAICRLLEQNGIYEFDYFDEENQINLNLIIIFWIFKLPLELNKFLNLE